MASFPVNIPDSLRPVVDARVAESGYHSPDEYIRDLIVEDQKRAERARLEKLLQEGLDSGDPIKCTPEFWERKRRELIARVTRNAERRQQ